MSDLILRLEHLCNMYCYLPFFNMAFAVFSDKTSARREVSHVVGLNVFPYNWEKNSSDGNGVHLLRKTLNSVVL